MLDCLLLGDSIATGIAAVLNAGGPICAVAARVGAGSGELAAQIAKAGPYPVTIVSMGTNDKRGSTGLDTNLANARMALGRARVLWVLPYDRRAAYSVTQVAFRFGDELIDLAGFATRDRIHPASYREVAAALPK
ncbi:hypothetical protein [Sphingomonas crocodyli]|uniref:SGNH/GDSL hydrolase family protein n=1 Tax=Sphingomonas crocodyli TaxID=1979270 RepID=A0A437M6K2_9SPHN|nr:hypothetical protein [Sphingomonas crocodyli]RVT93277.1 hypothetical protein EOD43_05150 [Sphingomonas crocodyli]